MEQTRVINQQPDPSTEEALSRESQASGYNTTDSEFSEPEVQILTQLVPVIWMAVVEPASSFHLHSRDKVLVLFFLFQDCYVN